MVNNFSGAPTAGSHDYNPSTEEFQARIDRLEQRLNEVEAQLSAKDEKHPAKDSNKTKWKKVKKFFRTFIKPVLTFIPNFINAISGCKKAFTPAR